MDYCPECGDNRYAKGYECIHCGFPHLSDYDEWSIESLLLYLDEDEWQIRTDMYINSNEYEEDKERNKQ